MATPNMGLTLPTDHGSAEIWDTILDAVFTTIDSHDHSIGKGVKVPSAGLNINGDVSWNSGGTSYAITDLKAVDFTAIASTSVSSLAGALFVSDGTGGLTANELYWRTTSGTNVKVTSGAALNVGAFTGGIVGDYAAAGAQVAFDDALNRYTFKQQSPFNWAFIACGEVRIFESNTTDTVFVGHAAPSALAASYTVTWPLAVPGSTALVQVDNTGVMTFSSTVVNSTTFSNLITANAGLTGASGQHVTVAGAGRFKHGTMTLSVPWTAFAQIASGTAVAYSTGIGSAGVTGLTFSVEAPLQLPVGVRILTIRFYVADNATGPTTVRGSLISTTSAGAIAVAAGPSAATAGTGAAQTITLSSINITVPTLTSYSLAVLNSTGGAQCAVYMAEVDYDFP